jgi:hypothetical protein
LGRSDSPAVARRDVVSLQLTGNAMGNRAPATIERDCGDLRKGEPGTIQLVEPLG